MKPSITYKLPEFISALFILIFTYAATSKIFDYKGFYIFLQATPHLAVAAKFLVWALPASELFISLLLLIPSFRNIGLFAACIMMITFTIYIAYMLLTHSHLPCSCGGIISTLSWQEHLWLNIFLSLIAAVNTG
jgi:uncharacterized membrane protein YphA (DoxX/SURF4 family)